MARAERDLQELAGVPASLCVYCMGRNCLASCVPEEPLHRYLKEMGALDLSLCMCLHFRWVAR
jgi:hypothetical protein